MHETAAEQKISIHALCEEGDAADRPFDAADRDFYPRPLRGGRQGPESLRPRHWDFYPRPLRGGRHAVPLRQENGQLISIHALCEEGDETGMVGEDPDRNFYPRPLRGGRLSGFPPPWPPRTISIHALCEEGDR